MPVRTVVDAAEAENNALIPRDLDELEENKKKLRRQQKQNQGNIEGICEAKKWVKVLII